jgi:hypothetical protein
MCEPWVLFIRSKSVHISKCKRSISDHTEAYDRLRITRLINFFCYMPKIACLLYLYDWWKKGMVYEGGIIGHWFDCRKQSLSVRLSMPAHTNVASRLPPSTHPSERVCLQQNGHSYASWSHINRPHLQSRTSNKGNGFNAQYWLVIRTAVGIRVTLAPLPLSVPPTCKQHI